MGSGRIGIRAAKHSAAPSFRPANAATMWPHSRPWHGPMPARVAALVPCRSFQPVAAACRISPALTPSQRQT
jgi:hypothetical protein